METCILAGTRKRNNPLHNNGLGNTPEGIRTPDLRLRRPSNDSGQVVYNELFDWIFYERSRRKVTKRGGAADGAVLDRGRQEARKPFAAPPNAAEGISGVAISDSRILIMGRPVAPVHGKLVFLTSTFYGGGNLGGLAGADAKCNERAAAAGLSGSYKAWMADDACGPRSSRPGFTHSTEPYTRVDGVRIADDFATLIFEGVAPIPLQAPIDVSEFGQVVTNFPVVWTGTGAEGEPPPLPCGDICSCQGWTSAAPIHTAIKGGPEGG